VSKVDQVWNKRRRKEKVVFIQEVICMQIVFADLAGMLFRI